MDVDSYFFKTLLILAVILILFILFKNTQLALNRTSRFYVSTSSNTPVSNIFDCVNKNADECDMSKCTYTNNTCKNIESIGIYINKSSGPPAPLKKGIYHVVSIPKGTDTNEVIQCNVFDPSNTYQDDSYNKPHILVSGYNGKSLSIFFFFKRAKSDTNTNARTLLSFIDKNKAVYDITITTGKLGGNLVNSSNQPTINVDTLYFFGFNLYVKESEKKVYAEMILVAEGSPSTDSYYSGEEYHLKELNDLNIANLVIGGKIGTTVSQPFNGIMQTVILNTNLKYTRTPINDLKKASGFYVKDIIVSNQELVNQIDIEVPSAIDVSVKVRDNELDLYWLRPEKGSNNITSYLIVLNEIDSDTKNKIRKYFVHNNDGCTNCNYTIRNLNYNEYHIGVVGVNNVGTGYVSDTLKRVVLTHPLDSVKTPVNNQQMLSCNPDGSYMLGSICYSQTPIVSNISDTDVSIINNSLNTNEPLYFDMNKI